MELYKKHRPETLDDISGNESTVAALRNMLERKTLPHTVLFHGPSGCGKTTLARIVRRELGCHDMDFQEVNSSSFRGIDSIRDISRAMYLAPGAGGVRVWVFDEVHKWTNDAQNASLKMLEDTPKHVWFILCTTSPNYLLQAIRTRCCELAVRALTYEELSRLVRRVARKEKIALIDDVLDELVATAQGSARMALVLLDKISNLDQKEQVKAIADRAAEENEAIDLCRALLKRDGQWPTVTKILKNLKADPESTRRAVMGYARSVLLGNTKPDQQAYLVIDVFAKPFYDSGDPGLAAACYEAVFGS